MTSKRGSPSATTATPVFVLVTIVVVAALIGGNFTALKYALDHADPLSVTALRTMIGGTFLVALAVGRGERFPTDRVVLARIFVVSFSITTVSSALLVFGVSRVPAGFASLIASTMPLFTATLSLALLHVRIRPLGALGLLIGFGGTAVLASPALGGGAELVGAGSLLLSALAWAFGTVFMKWKDLSAVSPIMLVGVQLWMSAVVLVPFALGVEGVDGTDWSIGLFVPLLYAAIPANAVTFSLIATVVRRATPTQAAATAYLIPLFGVFFGWLIRDEVLGRVELAGGLLVVVGVAVVATAGSGTDTGPTSASTRPRRGTERLRGTVRPSGAVRSTRGAPPSGVERPDGTLRNMSKISVIAKLTAAEGKADDLLNALHGVIDAAAEEDGLEVYSAHAAVDEPGVYYFFELYRDQDAIDKHGKGERMRDAMRAFGGLLAGRPEVTTMAPVAAKGLGLEA